MKLVKIKGDLADFKRIANWENDPVILPYLTPSFKEAPHRQVDPYHMFKHREGRNFYYITVDEQPIGMVDYTIDPPHLHDKSATTAWPSICIGEHQHWGKGYARQALIDLEAIIWQAGLERIEIGVFGYNTKAKKLYESLGYQYIAVYHNFTYFEGEWHNDFRLEKYNPLLDKAK